MTGRDCDVPSDGHDGTLRLYVCGWRCTTHAPQARTTGQGDAPTAPTAPATRTRPATGPRRVTAALFVDLGEGREIKQGDRAGQMWWTTQPRARYECLACGWASEIVTGADAVKAFTAHIRTTHRATCPAAALAEGARAA
ncbi:hypothetical protein [Streptomyces sp. NPDC101132]|uniref:hypothetical protein n=1 Tax=Streptomyces sp. NPDC101132 TaxID=3366110 RepID=UPI00380E9ACB